MLVVLPVSYLPPISYIRAYFLAETATLEIHETYRKQTIRNHCFIAGPNGRQQLTIPVIKVNGNHTRTKDIRISYTQEWQKNHWRSIETAYNKSPFFLYYRDYLEPFYRKRVDSLLDFNTGIMEVIFRILRIEKEILFTETFQDLTLESTEREIPPYQQVFGIQQGFLNDLSIVDLIFNLGPQALDHISRR